MRSLVAFFLLSLAATSVAADEWPTPTPKTYTSHNGKYRLTVFPRQLASALSYFDDKVSGSEPAGQQKHEQDRCEATLERLVGSRYEQLWRKPLVNDVAPVSALVSDADGSFITFDNWHSMGWGNDAIVIYSGKGMAKKKLPLTAIMTKKEFDNLPHSVSSIWWSGEHELEYDERSVNIRVVVDSHSDDIEKEFKTVRIDLTTAEIVK
jgi:hypothetical protein